MSLRTQIKTYATQTLGFDDCRFANPFLSDKLSVYRQWIKKNQHGTMEYLAAHLPKKENPELLLKDVRTAIVVIKNYKNTTAKYLTNRFKIARYAVGKDYHLVIEEKLRALEQFIKSRESSAQCFIGVDSRPIAERSLALEAGIGFLGKNSMVIKPGLGSYCFIGVILTTLKLKPDLPLKKNCGTCRRCIDACPTSAIRNDYTLYAKRCISYQTIERKTPLSVSEIKKARGWVFGCDICQEVCPYNHAGTPLTDWEEFLPKSGVGFDAFDGPALAGPLSINPERNSKSHDEKSRRVDFFEKSSKIIDSTIIPKDSALYRSRKTVVPNCVTAQNVFQAKENN
ncbi:MAG TPA: tRNA epoxyqueuosine(34) reductase QueG [Candidatus Omnitrophota bacterium]|nr:tRNA epoxyqueuosine(34) reductase QueG [Candidatus Omnitrophota bacterium]HPD85385.1 tRNA epoxyqueuosine(34) reductase QueG [Candidatus Omnitrophota bacterium]HRZ04114.1 tRNA epoxyqueuosine(34) reductase QueG [Candidatus Omnitrophota bacterium]